VNHSRLSYPDIARIFGTGLISTGAGLLIFVFVTIVWGDPFTRISEASAQRELQQQFNSRFSTDPQALQAQPLNARETQRLAARYRASLKSSEVAGRLIIPKIGLRKYVVKGATPEPLKRGPGFYDFPPRFPGSGKPVAIAGHRTTHGAPFLNVDKLKAGDEIIVDLPYARFTYKVTKTRIITPRDWSIINIGAAERNSATAQSMRTTRRCPGGTCEHLVLTACHPKYSAAQRIAIFARPSKVELRRAT
jgi:sortase A